MSPELSHHLTISLIGFALLTCIGASAGVDVTVNGQAVCGSFAVTWLPDEVRDAQQTGINMIYCYDRRASGQLLDPETELGAIVLEGGTGVMANFLHFTHSAKMAEDCGADETELQIAGARALPEAGLLLIGDEAVAYTSRDDTTVRGCTRGAEDTEPGAHMAGDYLFEQGLLREGLDRIKDSPNLWGFWVLDDKKGNQLPALKNLYPLIREWDVDADGEPYNHVVVAGYGSIESLSNFDAGVCDAAGLYLYPSRRGTYHINESAESLAVMVPTIRERDPEAQIIGIYQAFDGANYQPTPTRLQVREQALDYLRWGACGLMAYSWHMVEGANALREHPELREEVALIARDLREGRLATDQVPPTPPEPVEMSADPDALVPLLSFTDESNPGSPSAGLATTIGPVEGQDGQWVHLRFDRYEEGGNQWPGVAFTPDVCPIATTDWSAYAGFVARIANLTGEDSEIGVTMHGVTGMWAKYYPVPVGVSDVAVDLGLVRSGIPISSIRRFSIIMRRPEVETHLAVARFSLLPMQFDAADVRTDVPLAAPAEIDDPAWATAATLGLSGVSGAPLLKPCTVQLAHDSTALHVRFVCDAPDPVLLQGTTTEADAPMAGEDVVEVLLRPVGAASVARLRVNSLGAVRDEMLTPEGGDLTWSWDAQVVTRVADGRWIVTLRLPLAALGADAGDELQANFRRIDTELPSAAWITPTVPATESLGALTLMP